MPPPAASSTKNGLSKIGICQFSAAWATLSRPAMERLQELLGGGRHLSADSAKWRRHVDGDLELAVRQAETPTVVHVAEGSLTLHRLEVVVSRTRSHHGGDDER